MRKYFIDLRFFKFNQFMLFGYVFNFSLDSRFSCLKGFRECVIKNHIQHVRTFIYCGFCTLCLVFSHKKCSAIKLVVYLASKVCQSSARTNSPQTLDLDFFHHIIFYISSKNGITFEKSNNESQNELFRISLQL